MCRETVKCEFSIKATWLLLGVFSIGPLPYFFVCVRHLNSIKWRKVMTFQIVSVGNVYFTSCLWFLHFCLWNRWGVEWHSAWRFVSLFKVISLIYSSDLPFMTFTIGGCLIHFRSKNFYIVGKSWNNNASVPSLIFHLRFCCTMCQVSTT